MTWEDFGYVTRDQAPVTPAGSTDWWRLARGGDRTRLDKRTQQAVCEGGQISLTFAGLVLLTRLPSSSSPTSVPIFSRTYWHSWPPLSLQVWCSVTSCAVPPKFFVNSLQGSHDINKCKTSYEGVAGERSDCGPGQCNKAPDLSRCVMVAVNCSLRSHCDYCSLSLLLRYLYEN